MTIRLFDKDSHQKEFTARVLSCHPAKKGYAVQLDQTAFFPEGGGQSADTGFLNEIPVWDVQEHEGIITHFTDAPLECDAIVTGRLNWEERFRKMQNHSGEHIISGLIHRRFGLENVGFHLGNDDITMDYNGVLTREQLDEIEWQANLAVAQNLPITATYPPAEDLPHMEYRSKLDLTENVRIVTIEGYDACACCAPHLTRTGEIGLIKILDFIHYKGGIRVHLQCGLDALLDYRKKYENIARIAQSLSAKQHEAAQAVANLQAELEAQKAQLTAWKKRLADLCLRQLTPTDRNLCLFEEWDVNTLRYWVNGAMEFTPGLCCAFCGNDTDGYRYVIGSRTVPLRAKSKEFHQALSGKGGGTDQMLQGSFPATRQQIEDFFAGKVIE